MQYAHTHAHTPEHTPKNCWPTARIHMHIHSRAQHSHNVHPNSHPSIHPPSTTCVDTCHPLHCDLVVHNTLLILKAQACVINLESPTAARNSQAHTSPADLQARHPARRRTRLSKSRRSCVSACVHVQSNATSQLGCMYCVRMYVSRRARSTVSDQDTNRKSEHGATAFGRLVQNLANALDTTHTFAHVDT